MAWFDSFNAFLSTIASGGAAGAVVTYLSRDWISTRLKASIGHEYARKLEAYKTELQHTIEREVAIRTAAHASFSEGQKASMERKLDGIDKLWSTVLILRNKLPGALGFMDLLTVDEYRSARENQHFRELTNAYSMDSLTQMTRDNGVAVEGVRPYVGEHVWLLFWCYQAIHLRILFLLLAGREDAAKLEWHKDGGTRQLMAAVFTPTELTHFDQTPSGKITWLQRRLEAKLLNALQKVISGEAFGADSLAQAVKIQEEVINFTRQQKT
jgi:hypothetical protein